MSEHPISVQIGRLIGNLLAGEGAVYLPSVGSLHVVRRGARRISKRQVQPPGHETRFSQEVLGRALPEVIAGEIDGDAARAQELYETWLAQSRSGEVLTIFGVGTLQNGLFRMEAEFDRRLNPQGSAPVQLKRLYRFDWALVCGLVAILAAVGFGGYHFLQHYADDAPQPERNLLAESEHRSDSMNGPDVPSEPRPHLRLQPQPQPHSESQSRPQLRPLPQPKAHSESQSRPQLRPLPHPEQQSDDRPHLRSLPQSEQSEQSSVQQSKQPSEQQSGQRTEPQPQPKPAPAAEPTPAPAVAVHNETGEPADLAAGQHYVVLGVYSTIENARRACKEVAEQDAGLRCGIYRFGEKFLITPFSSGEEESCQSYARGQREAFPDVWVYTAR